MLISQVVLYNQTIDFKRRTATVASTAAEASMVLPFDIVVTSPLTRALQTTALLLSAAGHSTTGLKSIDVEPTGTGARVATIVPNTVFPVPVIVTSMLTETATDKSQLQQRGRSLEELRADFPFDSWDWTRIPSSSAAGGLAESTKEAKAVWAADDGLDRGYFDSRTKEERVKPLKALLAQLSCESTKRVLVVGLGPLSLVLSAPAKKTESTVGSS